MWSRATLAAARRAPTLALDRPFKEDRPAAASIASTSTVSSNEAGSDKSTFRRSSSACSDTLGK
jgi:hypothetical protein